MSKLHAFKKAKVWAEPPLVHIKVAGVKLEMEYQDALNLSQLIRIKAKEAKFKAGDRSRSLSLAGWLHDASAEQRNQTKESQKCRVAVGTTG